MVYVADLLRSGSRIPFTRLAGPADATPLASVTAVETLDDLRFAPAGALAVLTGKVASKVAGYQVDIAIRTAAERGVPALALIGGGALPITAVRLAERAGLAMLSTPEDCDFADVVLYISQVIKGDAADALSRAQAALRVLAEAGDGGGPGGSPAELVERVSDALGRTLTLTDEATAPGQDEGEPIWVAGRRHGGLTGPPDDAVRLVLPAAAATIGRLKAIALERETAPRQSRSDILTELIVAERIQAGLLADRARALGLAVDDVHIVVWITSELAGADPAELAERRRLFETLTLHAYQARHPGRESWNLARLAADIVLVGSARAEIGQARARQMVALLRAAVADEHPWIVPHFGIGTAQRGIDGLRQSAMEARAAASIAARAGELVRSFDATGINRILAGIAGSPLSRRMIDDLLGPLDRLPADRSVAAIETLCAYLDARGSLKAAAARLRLHPNAVNYRIRRITEQLGADLTDPDTAFALHLACRVRLRD